MTRREIYTHGHAESVLRSHTWRTPRNSAAYLLGHLRSGLDLLDVGCGPGTITVGLADFVAPGRVLGVDRSEDVIEGARATHRQEIPVEFRVDDAYALDLPEHSFDVVHAHQVLQHLSDPVAALHEWHRVCRPGGIIAARDCDYTAFTWFPADPLLDRSLELYRGAARANGGEPDAGRHLLSWARAAGFEEVTATASIWCFATPEDRAWWGTMWADRVRSSALTIQLLDAGVTQDEIDAIADAWLRWAASPDGWFIVPHGEIIAGA